MKNSFREDRPSLPDSDEMNENDRFHPMAEDWFADGIGILNSTVAIAEARYKMVNSGGAGGSTPAKKT